MHPKIAVPAVLAAFAAWLFAAEPVAVIPIRLNPSHQLFIEARINGSDPITCNLDSGGGDRVYLDRQRAFKMGVQPTGGGLSAGPGDAKMSHDARARVTVEAGGLTFPYQSALLQDRPYADFSCVVGQTIFQRYVVEIDYQTPAVRLYEPEQFHYEGSGRALTMVMDNGNPFLDTTIVTLNGKSFQPRLSVDTGCGSGFASLSKAYLDKTGVMNDVRNPIPDPRFGSAGQQARVVTAQFERLAVDGFEVAEPSLQLWQVAGFGGAGGPDGLLCGDFLRRFRMIFDYARKTLILEPNSR